MNDMKLIRVGIILLLCFIPFLKLDNYLKKKR